MSEETPKEKGEFKILEYGGKIMSIYRRCSCGGSVTIKKEEDGKNIADCTSCGAHMEWYDGDKIK
ncbi:hypothetical protein JR338_01365 [Chloroflexota bacterium]|nr:hypothetical protein JR338_01365 [Chloroflexota bacterium]